MINTPEMHAEFGRVTNEVSQKMRDALMEELKKICLGSDGLPKLQVIMRINAAVCGALEAVASGAAFMNHVTVENEEAQKLLWPKTCELIRRQLDESLSERIEAFVMPPNVIDLARKDKPTV